MVSTTAGWTLTAQAGQVVCQKEGILPILLVATWPASTILPINCLLVPHYPSLQRQIPKCLSCRTNMPGHSMDSAPGLCADCAG